MDHVGRGVRARDRPPALDVDLADRREPGLDLAVDDSRAVDVQPVDRLLDVVDLDERRRWRA